MVIFTIKLSKNVMIKLGNRFFKIKWKKVKFFIELKLKFLYYDKIKSLCKGIKWNKIMEIWVNFIDLISKWCIWAPQELVCLCSEV